MKKRVCDACGETKELKGGLTCAKGHFICAQCKRISGFIFSETRKKCPLCDKPLN